jgi:hypothetical protein
VITHGCELEKRNLKPGTERRALAVDTIQMPVDSSAVVEVFVAEQAEAMAADVVRVVQDFADSGGRMDSQEFRALNRLAASEEKSRWLRWRFGQSTSRWPHAYAIEQEVAPLVDSLSQTRIDLVPAHLGQARQLFVKSRRHRFPYLTCEKDSSGQARNSLVTRQRLLDRQTVPRLTHGGQKSPLVRCCPYWSRYRTGG